MRIRRIIYLALVAFLLIFLFNMDNNLFGSRTPMPIGIRTSDIVKEFQDLPSTVDSDLKSLYFPKDFSGQAGDVFYLVVEEKVYKYKIEILEGESSVDLVYELKDTYDSIALPQDKFKIFGL
ncbi:MAG TPA: hypothetical protein VFD02_00410 [Syntrophomonadaceae bacterium]|nr:hypothetical protein [Syntrophomonadaceae bacterium]